MNTSSKVERADGETDERFWEAMMNADRTDYERICSEFGVTDLQLTLKKLKEKKEKMLNKSEVGKLKLTTSSLPGSSVQF